MKGKRTSRLLSGFLLVAAFARGLWAQLPGDTLLGADDRTPAAISTLTPPKPPQVVCAGEQLTITADNSTMGGIMGALKNCLGIDVQMPKGFAEERTFVKLGPGPTRAVLDDLLGGTSFNYVIESSAPDRGKILAIVLTDRTSEASQPRDGTGAPQTPGQIMPARRIGPTNSFAERPVNTSLESEEPSSSVEARPDAVSQIVAKPTASGAAAARLDSVTPTEHDQESNGLAGFPSVRSDPTVPIVNDIQNTPQPVDAVAAPAQLRENPTALTPPTPAVTETPDAPPADAGITPDQLREKQITQMQQMFEERKNLIANPPPAANPPLPPLD